MNSLTEAELKNINRGIMTIRVIWVGLTIALGIYMIIGNILGEGLLNDPDEPDDEAFVIVGYILYALAAIELVVVSFIRKSITNPDSTVAKIIGFASMTDPLTVVTSQGDPNSAIARYTGGLTICFGLIESIGVYGLVLFMLNGDFLDLYVLCGIAISAMLFWGPRKQELTDLTYRLKGVDPGNDGSIFR